jgi:hypothetical protein
MTINRDSDSPFTKPTRIVRVLLERREQGLELVIRFRREANHFEQDLRFVGVTELQFRGETTDLTGLVLLQCEDISSRGWENAHFRVKDYEEEFVSFYCRAIEDVPRGGDEPTSPVE